METLHAPIVQQAIELLYWIEINIDFLFMHTINTSQVIVMGSSKSCISPMFDVIVAVYTPPHNSRRNIIKTPEFLAK